MSFRLFLQCHIFLSTQMEGMVAYLHVFTFLNALYQSYQSSSVSSFSRFYPCSKLQIQNPAALPSNPKNRLTACWEPTVIATIIIPSE